MAMAHTNSHEKTLAEMRPALLKKLHQALPTLLAVYVFGSRANDQDNANSDLDLAIFTEDKMSVENLWALSGDLADITHCSVDLIDLVAASTVMQYQIITTGQRWWEKDSQAAIYEAFILSEKTALDSARAGILNNIQQTGAVYGG